METLNIVGVRRGSLVGTNKVVRRHKSNTAYVVCVCDCGGERLVQKSAYMKGAYKSCGCAKDDGIKLGDKYNRWTVLRKDYSYGRKKYLCRCICGNESLVLGTGLKDGTSKGCKKCGHLLDSGESAKNKVISYYQSNAKKCGREFLLSNEDIDILFQSPCFYCGVERSKTQKTKGGSFSYNGIDRVDNNLGYTRENVVTCCYICNRAKREMEIKEFTNWLDRVARFRASKGELNDKAISE